MPKDPKDFIDWGDWKPGQVQPEHPMSKILSKNIKNGADAAREVLTTGILPTMLDAPLQPTNQQLFGHLVVSEEQMKKSEEKWNNAFKTLGFRGKVDSLNKNSISNREWKPGKSFNSLLTDEEKEERNSYVGE